MLAFMTARFAAVPLFEGRRRPPIKFIGLTPDKSRRCAVAPAVAPLAWKRNRRGAGM